MLDDFNLLATLLSGYIPYPLIDRTEVLYNLAMEALQKKKQKEDEESVQKNMNIGIGLALGVGVLGFFMAAKKSLF